MNGQSGEDEPGPRVFSLAQVAERLAGVSVRTVQRLIHDGDLNVVYLRGKPVVTPEELAPFITSLRTAP
ncbi:helix-turn-helix domain-containing protein [Luteimicrobium sp. NPDC057192]|uniref:helix-turn-helix domain-containing protein n=1 Tax=Luteimicrobium sp. NPDC057192 TaxID=3346042 RepID=UPI003630EC4B